MSKEKSESKDSPETAPASVAGNRRASKSRSGKPAKSAKMGDPAPEEPLLEPSAPPYPVFDMDESGASVDSSEPSGAAEISPQEKTKRKRRRKKGKGGGSSNAAQASMPETAPEAEAEAPAGTPAPSRHSERQPKLKLDSESVAKLARKIYLAEISEEGVALIADNDAKELSRRCFRLAEIFIEELTRRS